MPVKPPDGVSQHGQGNPRATCPSCDYDLTGLSFEDRVTCPECGGVFSAPAVLAKRPWKWRRPVLGARLVGVAALLMVWLATVDHLPCVSVVLLWPVALLWAVPNRERGRSLLWPSVAAAAIIATANCVPNTSWWFTTTAMRVMLANGIPLVAWGLLWVCSPRPVFAGLLLMLALIPGVPGLALVSAASAAYANGDYWTDWNSAFPAISGQPWELGRRGAMREGLFLLAPAGLLAAGAVIVDRRSRRGEGNPGGPP